MSDGDESDGWDERERMVEALKSEPGGLHEMAPARVREVASRYGYRATLADDGSWVFRPREETDDE